MTTHTGPATHPISRRVWEDEADPQRCVGAPALLAAFNEAGVLMAADVHVARVLAALGRDDDPAVQLAIALAVRAPRLGHVCVDLATVAATAQSEEDESLDVASLAWPPTPAWLAAVAASPLVDTAGGTAPTSRRRPLHLAGSTLYLDRYWIEEAAVAADLHDRSATGTGVDPSVLTSPLRRLFPDDPGQRLAGAQAALRRLTVVAGGPGTGKTTTVARILALLGEHALGRDVSLPRVALVAPTGKAAARLEQSVREEVRDIDTAPEIRSWAGSLPAGTIHRLLGWRRDSASRFQHDRFNRLAYELIVVDETSMVSLSLMARLLEAVRPSASVILVGDPDQLSSVEAGAVLADVVGPAAAGPIMHERAAGEASVATGDPVEAGHPPPGSCIGDGIVVLRTVHRFGGAIGSAAEAIQRGDADAAVEVLRRGDGAIRWVHDAEEVRCAVVAAGSEVARAAASGDAATALEAAGVLRILCANRRGPGGVESWTTLVERWMAAQIPGYGSGGPWYPGRPLLVTRNDYGLGLFNGDIGVVVTGPGGRTTAVFERKGELAQFAPTRLDAVETVHAMTVHKGQGSQFEIVIVVLPEPGSRALTRELLYTAVTRARRQVLLVGSEEAVRAAILRPVARASGLRQRLWAPQG